MGSEIEKLDFQSVEYRSNPIAAFDRLRARGTVVKYRIPLVGKTWLATSHEAVADVFKDHRSFLRDPKSVGRRYQLSVQWVLPRMFKRLSQNMINRDGADHRRLRALADQAFQRRSVDEMRPRIVEIAREQLQTAIQSAKSNDGTVDLVENFARSLPLAVICELLGLPESDRPKFISWFAPFSDVSGAVGLLFALSGLHKGLKYIQRQIQEQRVSPRDGLIAELIKAEESGSRLNQRELESTILLLLLAGYETTVHLLSVSVLHFLQSPEDRVRFFEQESAAQETVLELLRFTSVAQYGKPRFVQEDMTFHGAQMTRGDAIMPVIAAANFDPHVFDRPHEFDIERRNNNQHFTFGRGPHICLGLKLAEAETEIALRELFNMCPDLQAAFDLKKPDWGKRMGMRSLKTLRVRTMPARQ